MAGSMGVWKEIPGVWQPPRDAVVMAYGLRNATELNGQRGQFLGTTIGPDKNTLVTVKFPPPMDKTMNLQLKNLFVMPPEGGMELLTGPLERDAKEAQAAARSAKDELERTKAGLKKADAEKVAAQKELSELRRKDKEGADAASALRKKEADALAAAASAEEKRKAEVKDLEGKLAKAKRASQSQGADLKASQEKAAALEGKVAELEGRLGEADQASKALESERAKVSKLESDLKAAKKAAKEGKGTAAAQAEAAEKLTADLAAATAAAADLTSARDAALADLQALKAKMGDAEKSSDAKSKKVEHELKEARKQLAAMAEKAGEAASLEHRLQSATDGFQDRVAELERELSDARRDAEAARQSVGDVQRMLKSAADSGVEQGRAAAAAKLQVAELRQELTESTAKCDDTARELRQTHAVAEQRLRTIRRLEEELRALRGSRDEAGDLRRELADHKREVETARGELGELRAAALRSRQLAESAERSQRDFELEAEALRGRAAGRDAECSRLAEQLRSSRVSVGELEGQLASLRRRLAAHHQGSAQDASHARAELEAVRLSMAKKAAAALSWRHGAQRSILHADETHTRRAVIALETSRFELLNATFRWEARLRVSDADTVALRGQLRRAAQHEADLQRCLDAERQTFAAAEAEREAAAALSEQVRAEAESKRARASAEREAEISGAAAARIASLSEELREERVRAGQELGRADDAERRLSDTAEQQRSLQLRLLEVLQEEKTQREGREESEAKAALLTDRLGDGAEALAAREREWEARLRRVEARWEELLAAAEARQDDLLQRADAELLQVKEQLHAAERAALRAASSSSARAPDAALAPDTDPAMMTEARACIASLNEQLRVYEAELSARELAAADLASRLRAAEGTASAQGRELAALQAALQAKARVESDMAAAREEAKRLAAIVHDLKRRVPSQASLADIPCSPPPPRRLRSPVRGRRRFVAAAESRSRSRSRSSGSSVPPPVAAPAQQPRRASGFRRSSGGSAAGRRRVSGGSDPRSQQSPARRQRGPAPSEGRSPQSRGSGGAPAEQARSSAPPAAASPGAVPSSPVSDRRADAHRALFQRLDIDGDGRLSRLEWGRLRAVQHLPRGLPEWSSACGGGVSVGASAVREAVGADPAGVAGALAEREAAAADAVRVWAAHADLLRWSFHALAAHRREEECPAVSLPTPSSSVPCGVEDAGMWRAWREAVRVAGGGGGVIRRADLRRAVTEDAAVQQLLCLSSAGEVDERRIGAVARLAQNGGDADAVAWDDLVHEFEAEEEHAGSRRPSAASTCSELDPSRAAASVRSLRHASRAARDALRLTPDAPRFAAEAAALALARDSGDAAELRSAAAALLRLDPPAPAASQLLRAVSLLDAAGQHRRQSQVCSSENG
eukprot:TRINITY_DN6913_c1_g1_i1.p1 TRINITY_DN6913_c1_g1~~TRINITY_DN6913_c1_g1_i1.p1  ORF type:complete len:1395 (+),score=578.55 TRINITY_DN6913_c1_g1_i1:89-4273(+)